MGLKEIEARHEADQLYTTWRDKEGEQAHDDRAKLLACINRIWAILTEYRVAPADKIEMALEELEKEGSDGA